MKVRESGMPAKEVWDTYFNPVDILQKLGLGSVAGDVVEFGCGYGTFTLPAARMITGVVHALDVDADLIRAAESDARAAGIENIRFSLRDFVADGAGLAERAAGFAMLFNILHGDNPVALLAEARRILNEDGLLGIIHWVHDEKTPRGPPLSIRPRIEQCQQWAGAAGLHAVGPPLSLPPYHYGLVFRR